MGMNALFAAATGGEDWAPMADTLFDVDEFVYVLFLAYISFFIFVVLNTMTALFVDALSQRSQNDDYHMMQERLRNQASYLRKIQKLYRRLGKDGCSTITCEEFREHSNAPEMLRLATSLQIDVTDLQIVFDILSGHGQHAIEPWEFVVGCIRLRGVAKSVDLLALSLDHRRNIRRQHEFEAVCLNEFMALRRDLGIFAAELNLQDSSESLAGFCKGPLDGMHAAAPPRPSSYKLFAPVLDPKTMQEQPLPDIPSDHASDKDYKFILEKPGIPCFFAGKLQATNADAK